MKSKPTKPRRSGCRWESGGHGLFGAGAACVCYGRVVAKTKRQCSSSNLTLPYIPKEFIKTDINPVDIFARKKKIGVQYQRREVEFS